MSSLPDDLDALSAGAPPVADWPGLVRATVRARRRRRAVASAAAALSLVAVSGIGVVYAAGDGREPSTLVVATEAPTPSPTPTASSTENVVTVDIEITPSLPKVGEEVTITVIARGDKGGVRFSTISFDRGRQTEMAPSVACAPAEPVAPQPGSARRDITFVYQEAFTDAIYARADSGCGYYFGAGEGRRSVVVAPADAADAPASSPAVGATMMPTSTRPSSSEPRGTVSPTPPYRGRNVITLDVSVSPAQPKVGEQVTITVVARGDSAAPSPTRFTWDRGREGKAYPMTSCVEPTPGPARPGERTETTTFVYDEAGPEQITFAADSGCSYFEGRVSTTFELEVLPAA